MTELTNSDDFKRVVAKGYDQVAHAYAQLEGETPWPRMHRLSKLLSRLAPGSAVLDLGCGSGEPAGVEIAKVHQLTGVDISQRQIALARAKAPAGHFIHADVASVAFPDASFDAVVSFYALEHLPRTEHATILQRIYRWLRRDGYFLLSTEADEIEATVSEWLDVPMFFSSFAPETIKQMVRETGFEILEASIETQLEGGTEIPYLWILARKPEE